MPDLHVYLERLTTLHDHLCPRQVLGLRVGLFAARSLGLDVPRSDKRLLAFVETDGCFIDGVSVMTGCSMGHRTMRLMDFGKVAATFVDVQTSCAVRVIPHAGCRDTAWQYAPDAADSWHAQLAAYQVMPDDDLLIGQPVTLTLALDKLISRPGLRVTCAVCGEEILNEREVIQDGLVLCQGCAGPRYYQPADYLLSVPTRIINDRADRS